MPPPKYQDRLGFLSEQYLLRWGKREEGLAKKRKKEGGGFMGEKRKVENCVRGNVSCDSQSHSSSWTIPISIGWVEFFVNAYHDFYFVLTLIVQDRKSYVNFLAAWQCLIISKVLLLAGVSGCSFAEMQLLSAESVRMSFSYQQLLNLGFPQPIY